MNIRKRVMSLVLALIMTLAMFPQNVFGVGPGSGAADDSNYKAGGVSDNTWGGKISESGMGFC